MSAFISVFEPDSYEHDRLRLAAAIMTVKSPRGYQYHVEDTYFDFGQDWKWTTIVREDSTWGGVQALNPRQQEEIILADNIEAAVDAVFEDEWCTDRKGA